MIVDVAFVPGLVLAPERKVAIVVDALRASSTIVAMFDAGAKAISVAANPDEAMAIAADDRDEFLICGEAGGQPPPGFDYGNSPVQIATLDLTGRHVILSTSNGTRALHAVSDAHLVLVGTRRNGVAVARHALAASERDKRDLTIVCAGDERGILFSLEDLFFAGYLVELLARERPFTWPMDEHDPRPGDPSCWVLDESAVAARRVYDSYLPESSLRHQPPLESILGVFRDARNGHTLPRIGYAADLDYCAAVDCSSVVPRLTTKRGHYVLIAED